VISKKVLALFSLAITFVVIGFWIIQVKLHPAESPTNYWYLTPFLLVGMKSAVTCVHLIRKPNANFFPIDSLFLGGSVFASNYSIDSSEFRTIALGIGGIVLFIWLIERMSNEMGLSLTDHPVSETQEKIK
jgi:peptidoglycan/LPS O-acetylase OafA/YrhL